MAEDMTMSEGDKGQAATPIACNWDSDEVTKSITNALKTTLNDDTTPLVIYYGRNKQKLWEQIRTENIPEFTEQTKNGLVLICDEPGYSSEYPDINPLTWSICALQKASESQKSLKIIIAGLDADTYSGHELYKIIQTLNPSKFPFRLLPIPLELSTCSDFLKKTERTGQPAAEDSGTIQLKKENPETTINVLLHQLRIILTAPGQEGNRHAISGMLGPMVLLRHDETKKWDDTQEAFFTIFEATGLIKTRKTGPDTISLIASANAGSEDDKALNSQASPEANKGASAKDSGTTFMESQGKSAHTRLLIVDDQATQGWETWVSRMAPPPCTVQSLNVTDFIAHITATIGGKKKDVPDLRFKLVFNSTPPAAKSEQAETILLLDLRLFDLSSVDTEARFVNKIISLCREFIEDGKDYAWPGFSAQELKAAEAWCQKPERETPEHWHVLSLLPRLLALADFSIPIVLFSSTSQRRIIQFFKPYGNIITDFEKPRFTGVEDTEDLAKETEERFRSALLKASGLLAARTKCHAILSAPNVIPQHTTPSNLQTRYIELFIDECEGDSVSKDYFSVGGCFAVYEDTDVAAAHKKADAFDRELVHRGARYFHSPIGIQVETPLKKKTSMAPHFTDNSISSNHPSSIGLVRLNISNDAKTADNIMDLPEADNRFYLALKTIVELFICESLPAIERAGGGSETRVSVFAGTRANYISDTHRQATAKFKYGYKQKKIEDGKPLFSGFNSNQMSFIITDILTAHAVNAKFYRRIAVQLPYKGHPTYAPEWFRCHTCNTISTDTSRISCNCPPNKSDWQPDYRTLHYLADDILNHFPKAGHRERYDAFFKGKDDFPFFSLGEFDEYMDDHLEANLAAGRRLDLNDIVGALSLFKPQGGTDFIKPRSSYWLQERLAAKLPLISGEDYLRLAHGLTPQRQKQENVTTPPQTPKTPPKWQYKEFKGVIPYSTSQEKDLFPPDKTGCRVIRTTKGMLRIFVDTDVITDQLPPGFAPPPGNLLKNGEPAEESLSSTQVTALLKIAKAPSANLKFGQ